MVKKTTAMNRARAAFSGFVLVVVERHGVELEPVIDQFVAELARDFGLQALDLLRLEFDHLAAAQIDQMVVVGFGGWSRSARGPRGNRAAR